MLRAGYRYSELRYDESGDRIPMVTDDGTLVATDIGQTVDIDVTQIEFAFLGKVNLFDTDIEILAGPSAGFSRHALRTQKMHLIPEAKFDTTLFRPGDIEFLDNGTAIVTSKDNISDLYPLRWALQLGTQYDLRFGRLHIIPGIGFIADLTGISPSTLSLRTHQLSGSLDVRWTLF
ncbi:MAG: hypothetical protein UZ06_CHB003000010 [Chlorobi bacterium OLB6]|nr:MAG: hypothetical protein UZ06_CHB003000010 [Chlorobi bacterium OLB6]MCC6331988.1 hypothetical protein [Ignavibacteria bacterium]